MRSESNATCTSGDPVSFSGSTSFLFDEDKGYSVIYGDGSSPWTAMPTNEFRLRAAIYWLGTYFETRLKAQKKTADDPIIKAALERKWFPIFVARLLLERAYPNDTWRPYLERLYKGDWRSETCKDREWADMLYELSLQVLLGAYRMASKGQSFVHRNWMRNPETVQQLREAAKDFAEFQLRALVRK